MLISGRTITVAFLGLLALTGGSSPSASGRASYQDITLISSLEAGEWQVRPKSGGEARTVCLSDSRTLVQVRHPKSICSNFIISNEPRQAVIHYTCPGAGHGRTSLKMETPRLVQIESQGIASNNPFQETYEARRIGACISSAKSNGH
jgi:hypothetical protein